jgi:hypothetical protein
MKKLFLSIFTISFLIVFSFAFRASAQAIFIDNIKTNKPYDGQVKLSWTTNQPSTSYVYFGTNSDNLEHYIANSNYLRSHQVILSGLKKDKNYYYLIKVKNSQGETSESFVNYFNTKGMVLTKAPVIFNFERLQAIDKSAAFSFKTDRETKIEFRYGLESDNLNLVYKDNKFKTNYFLVISKNLEAGERYYYRLTASDRDGNQAIQSGSFNTSSYSHNDLKISNLTPSSKNQTPSMPEKTILSWQSNLIANSEVVYGLSPDRLKEKVKVNKRADFKHYIVLENLKADTTYYYQIRMTSPLNKAKLNTQIYTFKTAPLNSDYLDFYWQSGDLVQYKKDNYLIYNNAKVPIYSSAKISSLAQEYPVNKIEKKYLEQYKNLPAYYGLYFDGQVVKEKNNKQVYLIDGKYRRLIDNWAVFTYLNYQASDIKIISSSELKKYKLGKKITHSQQITGDSFGAKYNNQLVKSKYDNTIYLIVNNKKLPFLKEKSFLKYNYNFSQVKTIDENILNSFSLGQVIL